MRRALFVTLTSTATVYRPITLEELISLVEILEGMSDDLESLGEIISLYGSFLTIREGIIYFVHQSAKDYLLVFNTNGPVPSMSTLKTYPSIP
jgi:hypothetical protein